MQPENTLSAPHSRTVLWLLPLLLAAACVLFMTLNIKGSWDYALPHRATKLAALVMAAYAVGVSTLLFQTITGNPILTPSVLGFDSMYIFLQTLLVALLGGIGYTLLPLAGKFTLEMAAMLGGSVLLFRLLLREGGQDLTRMILIGVIFGVLFRSLSSLLQRLIDPEEFATVQTNLFASFNTVNEKMLWFGAVVMAVSAVFIWRERYRLDVHLLGRDQVTNLGIPYRRHVLWILTWVAVLGPTAPALVGPVSFFGLLVCALTDRFAGSMKHAVRLPAAFFISALLLVAGQALFEHLLGMKGVLSAVVEFAGGLVFLYLVMKQR